LDGFAGYLRSERGVTELTVGVYVAGRRGFLVDRGGGGLGELTAADVSKAVLGQVTRWPPVSVRRYGCSLRSFLRYCYLVGLVDRDLPAAALPVSGRRRSLLPEGITPTRAKALLRAWDRRRASGRRDYAVIVVILRLGLRASEVATLRLEDLDWRAGQVTVHGKGHRVDQLPLPVDVGEAIAACLCRGRPRTATVREVFVRVRPPHVGLSRGAVTTIVARAAGRARLGAVRAHRLRHTAASDSSRRGGHLGHRPLARPRGLRDHTGLPPR
jgi:integrase/recombinase XerD